MTDMMCCRVLSCASLLLPGVCPCPVCPQALSKAAADLEDMDISHLISHLTRKEGSVDEKLIRDLQVG